MNAFSIDPQPGEPLAAWFSPERRVGALREQRFEYASAGDLVSGRCWWPLAAPASLVLAVHELSRNKEDAALVSSAALWASREIATTAIDLPLHGERYNAKLSRRAIAASAHGAQADLALWRGLVGQAVRDLARALDAIAARGPLPPVACVAFGYAAAIGLAFGSLDPRVTQVTAIGASRAVSLDGVGPSAKPLAWLARPDDLSLAG